MGEFLTFYQFHPILMGFFAKCSTLCVDDEPLKNPTILLRKSSIKRGLIYNFFIFLLSLTEFLIFIQFDEMNYFFRNFAYVSFVPFLLFLSVLITWYSFCLHLFIFDFLLRSLNTLG